MTLLVVGVSHRSASVALLEQFAVDASEAAKLAQHALDAPHVAEALVLATCNRVEIYAEVERFHSSVDDLTALLLQRSTRPPEEALPSLYVHYDEAAVGHLFAVATGLDSMVVGEPQILGQVRDALNRGQRDETLGPVLNSLFQQGLRVGKRAHAETGIDRAGQSLVSVALETAEAKLGSLADARACIVGTGSMAALTAASLRRAGSPELTIAGRSVDRGRRLAETVGARSVAQADVPALLSSTDLVVTCTGAREVVVSAADVAAAAVARSRAEPLVLVDLALPHDIDEAAGDLPGITLIRLEDLAGASQPVTDADVEAVEEIVAEEVTAFVAARSAAAVTPTLVALRSMATEVVAGELERLWARLDDLTPKQRAEIATAVRRVADKLLHEPTVRVKRLADQPPSASYADALAELFALDPATISALTGGVVERP
jgi:glutamyl-tRNA reductase